MFLQFFVLGATIPILSLYLREYLHFTGFQIGAVLAMSAVAAFVYPIIGALVADRLISARRLYGLCHLAGALLMVMLSVQDRFLPFLLLYLAYMLICGPTSALANVVTFHYLLGERLRFGSIRLWGTLGWIAVAWLFGGWLAGGDGSGGSRLPDAFKLSALASTLLGLYAFSLPAIARRPSGPVGFIPKEALQVMRRGEVLLLSGLAFTVSFLDRFYYFGTAPFLRQLGFSETAILPAMSLGQMTEVFAMGFLGFLIARVWPPTTAGRWGRDGGGPFCPVCRRNFPGVALRRALSARTGLRLFFRNRVHHPGQPLRQPVAGRGAPAFCHIDLRSGEFGRQLGCGADLRFFFRRREGTHRFSNFLAGARRPGLPGFAFGLGLCQTPDHHPKPWKRESRQSRTAVIRMRQSHRELFIRMPSGLIGLTGMFTFFERDYESRVSPKTFLR